MSKGLVEAGLSRNCWELPRGCQGVVKRRVVMQEARPNYCFSGACSRFELKSARLRKSQSRPKTEKISVSALEPPFGFVFLRKTIVCGFSTRFQARPIVCFSGARGRLELKSARVSQLETEKILVSALDLNSGFLFLRKTIVQGLCHRQPEVATDSHR